MDNLNRPRELPDYNHIRKEIPFLLRSERKAVRYVFRMADYKGYLSKEEFRFLPSVSQRLFVDMLLHSLATSTSELMARINNKQITIDVLHDVMGNAEQRYGKGHAFCELALYFSGRFKKEKSILEWVIGS